MGVGGVVAGYLSDRLGTRRVVLVGAGLLGLGLVLSTRCHWPLASRTGRQCPCTRS